MCLYMYVCGLQEYLRIESGLMGRLHIQQRTVTSTRLMTTLLGDYNHMLNHSGMLVDWYSMVLFNSSVKHYADCTNLVVVGSILQPGLGYT